MLRYHTGRASLEDVCFCSRGKLVQYILSVKPDVNYHTQCVAYSWRGKLHVTHQTEQGYMDIWSVNYRVG